MPEFTKSTINATMSFFHLLTANEIYTLENDEKIYISDKLDKYNEKLTLDYLSKFYIEDKGVAKNLFHQFFQQLDEDVKTSVVAIFQFSAINELIQQGLSGTEENISDFESELIVDSVIYFDELTFSDLASFVFQEEDLFLINSDAKDKAELISRQHELISDFNLDEDIYNLYKNIISNDLDKTIYISSSGNEEYFKLTSLDDGLFVGFKIDDINSLLISLYKVYIAGGVIIVKDFLNSHIDGENGESIPEYNLYSYSIYNHQITAIPQDDLIDSYSFDAITGEPLEQEVGVSYIDSPFEVI